MPKIAQMESPSEQVDPYVTSWSTSVGFEIYHIQSHILIKQNHYLSYKQRLDDTETNNFERR